MQRDKPTLYIVLLYDIWYELSQSLLWFIYTNSLTLGPTKEPLMATLHKSLYDKSGKEQRYSYIIFQYQ